MSSSPKKVRLGDLLVEQEVINQSQLEFALQEQKIAGTKLGRTLIDLGYVEEDQLLELLSRQLDIPFLRLREFQFNPEVTRRLPETSARRYRAIALSESNGEILVGMADPTDIFAFDDIARALNQPVVLAVVRETELLEALDMLYRRTDEIFSLAEELNEELEEQAFDLDDTLSADNEDAPIVRLLHSIFEDAVQVKASDIHIEPDEHVLRIRQRVDGVLQEQVMNEKRIVGALVLRLKLMCGLNISEKRMPQDGRFNVKIKKHVIDVRLSTLPTQHGESVVMRLLDNSEGTLDLEKIGMRDDMHKRFANALHQPHGLILVTGPTGSGKTTTLYGALTELNKPEKKIITVEDPVEYQLPRISQCQVRESIGFNFSKVLRACLRQDPDILLVGEIRDQETAEIALRAALTGHLVLSTLHTNDALASAMRLIDMGIDGYLVASAVRAVVAQRLIRRICDVCHTETELDDTQRGLLQLWAPSDENQTYYKGKGCSRCNMTGYRGRIGVFEFLELDDAMRDALRRNDASEFEKAAANNAYYVPLNLAALTYAREGITTLDEVVRVSETETVH
jgi:MSHA biogenesis protein MshE